MLRDQIPMPFEAFKNVTFAIGFVHAKSLPNVSVSHF